MYNAKQSYYPEEYNLKNINKNKKMNDKGLIKGNTPIRYDKEGTSNPIAKFLVNQFKLSIYKLLSSYDIKSILDVGCGKGEIISYLSSMKKFEIHGVDIEHDVIERASSLYPNFSLTVQDGKNLSYGDASFDLILVLEVLEHVEHYEEIIREAGRVSRGYCIFSVPREPLWRILNLLRGAHCDLLYTLGILIIGARINL